MRGNDDGGTDGNAMLGWERHSIPAFAEMTMG
jgi:hypothetical protein